ncbi:hypothetical protein DDQ41_15250 [Streptomyces spongiicola]|uniref:Helix-turn-helix domain-containing protein n=1 Tax=Streptomyces spongiicola TaxID=1690221 RepID=A0ABM6V7K6_9ACTN|nr:hypothetical protein [Streptomyces spongiicola]AWK10027.1 hypothetical protein DDQ41_15250 [Streptomyces spongiicola]
MTRRPSNAHRPSVSRPGSTGLRFGMFAVCVVRDPDAELNKGKAKPLYDLLVSFADVSSRDTGQGYPYREALAACLDCTKQTIDRATKYLEQEIGLVRVVHRKVEGKEDENDANLYMVFDAWLIQGVPPSADTPPQLVARYGHTIAGFDIEAWMEEHAPDFDLTGWRAAHTARLQGQQERRAEQRRKERARRKKSKKGGGVTDDATPEDPANEGGGVTEDATGGVVEDTSGGVMGDALSKAGGREPSSTPTDGGSAGGQGAGGLVPAGASSSAEPKADSMQDGSAVDWKASPTPKQRKATKVTEARPVPGEEDVWAALEPVLTELGNRPDTRPPTLRKAVRQLLGHNTDARLTAFDAYPRRPEHALARINRGWYRAQGPERAAKDYDGPDAIRRPVGYLATALTVQECIRSECELGILLTTGEECTVCEGRAAERAVAALGTRLETETVRLAAARQAREGVARPAFEDQEQHDVLGLPEQRATWRCETPTCRRLGRGTPPEVPLCSECQEDIRMALREATDHEGPVRGRTRAVER